MRFYRHSRSSSMDLARDRAGSHDALVSGRMNLRFKLSKTARLVKSEPSFYIVRMPKVSEQHRAAQRQRILDAARTCIDRSGLQAVTMQGIIAASGMSTGSVYGYFRGKDDIVVAAVAASLEDLG